MANVVVGIFVLLVVAFVAELGPCGSSFVKGPGAFSGATSARAPARLAAERGTGVREPPATVDIGVAESDSTVAAQGEIGESNFWQLVEAGEVQEAIIASWSQKQLFVKLQDDTIRMVREESDVEDLRDKLVRRGVSIRYPPGDRLSEQEALQEASLGSEGAVATGVLTGAAVGLLDAGLEVAGSVAVGSGAIGGQLEVQSLLENEGIPQVIAEDLDIINKDIRYLERAAESVEKLAVQEATQVETSFSESVAPAVQWVKDAAEGLLTNHAPGIGGIVEDSFMGLLAAVSLYSLYEMAFLKRKSNSFSGLAHTATGAMQIVTVLYAMVEERCFRESPGPIWAVFTFAIFMVNNITMWPLLKYFKGPEVQRVLFKLAYSFIISFQGIHAIAWSIQYPWLYWVVMPFWFYSIKKLQESSDNVLALLPDGFIPFGDFQEGARRRVKGIQNDAPTIAYSALNFAGAVFDNAYMAVYTWRGPAGFWGWSAENIPGINDHLRTGLVKPCFGSLTISVLVFLGTLVYRKKLDPKVAVALNVVLASVGPWLILYYHKLVDFDEPWQPEIMGDWGSSPFFIDHFPELTALLAAPFAVMGAKVLSAGSVPAMAEELPIVSDSLAASAQVEGTTASLGDLSQQ